MQRTRKPLAIGISVIMMILTGGVMEASNGNEFIVPLMRKVPVIDGKFSIEEWREAAGFDGMTQATGFKSGELDERTIRSYVGATKTDFYIAIESELPPGEATLIANVKKDISKVVFDDSFEIWIDPDPANKKSVSFQALFNSLGNGAYQVHTRGGGEDRPGWNGGYDIKNGFTPTSWVVEIKIPVKSIASDRRITEGNWGISVCRNWKQPWQQTCAPGKNFKGRDTRFVFSEKPVPVVKLKQVNDPFTRDFVTELSVYNPTPQTIKVKADLDLARDSMPTIPNSKEMTIAVGKTESFIFKHKERNSEAFELNASVTSDDGKIVYYRRSTAWGKPRKKRWDTTVEVKRPVDFKFAHYPYLKTLRIQADWSGLEKNAKLDSLNFTLKKQWDDAVVKSWKMDQLGAKNKLCELTLELPELDGIYEISMTATGTNVPKEPLIKTFVRKKYDWEHNTLGKSRKVYPPFTPIKVQERTVETVFRKHQLSNTGLPKSIKVKTIELLQNPISFEAKIGGESQALKLDSMNFEEKSDDRVITNSTFSLGYISCKAKGTWDYDGTLKYELSLAPTANQVVDELTLSVPLRDEIAPMIHAMIEGLRRGPISETLPAGDGEIWNSKSLLSGDMPNGFCSYIFLGSPLRGLSWFAENDKDWSWDRSTPNMSLVRRGNTLSLNIHLINKPVEIKEPRKITFGLLAAPVKPRLPNWRTFWWKKKCSVLGTSINWLAGPGICGNVYPAGKDPYFWRFVADANVREMSKDEVDDCVRRGLQYFTPFEMEERWTAHVRRQGSGARLGRTQIFYYNRATTACDEEYATFINEWSLKDWAAHDFKREPWEIKIVPSESYVDFAVYWYAKSFEFGRNQGVYWDNWYLRPTNNTFMTDAYSEGEDAIIPATGIWELRELCKRAFVLMNERGMVPITMPHMTSTNILPMHSFATVQYDWEWKYSTGDVQYRHTRDYLQLVSNGELAGTIPVPLHEHGAQAKDEWTQRTFAGVSLVHELETSGYGKVWETLRDPLIPILEDPKLKVWRYWDEEKQPVTTGNPDLPLIVYSVPGQETVVILCGYLDKDTEVTLSIDPKKLGLGDSIAVSNFETGETIPVNDDKVKLKLKKHEVIALKIK